jgi:hypothetical protein
MGHSGRWWAVSRRRHRLVRWRTHLRIHRHLGFTPLRHPSASRLERFQCSSTQERAIALSLFWAKEAVTVKRHCKHRRAASHSAWLNGEPFVPVQHKSVMESSICKEGLPIPHVGTLEGSAHALIGARGARILVISTEAVSPERDRRSGKSRCSPNPPGSSNLASEQVKPRSIRIRTNAGWSQGQKRRSNPHPSAPSSPLAPAVRSSLLFKERRSKSYDRGCNCNRRTA